MVSLQCAFSYGLLHQYYLRKHYNNTALIILPHFVRWHMLFKIIILWESFVTIIALVWILSSEYFQVTFNISTLERNLYCIDYTHDISPQCVHTDVLYFYNMDKTVESLFTLAWVFFFVSWYHVTITLCVFFYISIHILCIVILIP